VRPTGNRALLWRVVPFLAYVHAEDRDPRPDGPRQWEPDWRVWRWVAAALVVTYGAVRADGAVEVLLAFVVFGLVCRALLELLPEGDGMNEYRQ
jgi:hypothetical protein